MSETSLPNEVSSLQTDPAFAQSRARHWIPIALLALLLHLAIYFLKPFSFSVPAPARVDLTEIDPAKLDAIRKQWKDRGLLLNTDPTPKDPNAKAPEDARYESDRNRRVEKEQRARVTDVLPKPGTAGKSGARPVPAQPLEKPVPLAKLSNLKIPGPGQKRPSPQDQAREAEAGVGGNDGRQQTLLDPSLAEGDQNLLNTQESKYYSFYARIYETIAPLWQSRVRTAAMMARLAPGEYQTRAEIVMDADGNYVETHIISSSGVPGVDNAISEAWRKVPRFPNPPRDLIGNDGKIHMGWTFSLSIDTNAGLRYLPPERNY